MDTPLYLTQHRMEAMVLIFLLILMVLVLLSSRVIQPEVLDSSN